MYYESVNYLLCDYNDNKHGTRYINKGQKSLLVSVIIYKIQTLSYHTCINKNFITFWYRKKRVVTNGVIEYLFKF